jgi:hypothetical protein
MDIEGQRQLTDITFALGPGVVEEYVVFFFEVQGLGAPVHCGLGGAVEKDGGGFEWFDAEGFVKEAATVFCLEIRHRYRARI